MKATYNLSNLSDADKEKRIQELEEELRQLKDAPPQASDSTSDDIYAHLFHHSTHCNVLFADGQIVIANQRLAELTGYTLDELYDMSGDALKMLIHPQDLESVTTSFLNYMDSPQSQPHHTQYRITRKDGQIRWIYSLNMFIPYNDTLAIHNQSMDITDNLFAHKSKDYQNILVEHISDAVISYDMDTRIKSWNHAAQQLFGYSLEEAIGQRLQDLLSSRPVYSDVVEYQEQFTEYGKWQGEFAHRHKDGSEIITWVSVSMLHDEQHTPIGFVSFQHDITPRKIFEDRLETLVQERTRELEIANRALEAGIQRYSTLVQHFPNGIVGLVNTDLQFEIMGGSGLLNLSYAGGKLTGRRLSDFMPEDIAQRDEPSLKAALEGETRVQVVEHEGRIHRVHTLPIFGTDDQIIAAMVMSQDITALKQAETAIRTSEERYRTLLHSIPDVVCIFDSDMRFTLVNEALASNFSMTVEELQGMHVLDLLPGFDSTSSYNTYLQSLQDHQPRVMVGPSYRNKDAEIPEWYETRIYPVSEGILIISRDITRQREIDAQKLEFELARQHMHTIDELVHNLAHDLRTPLSIINTSLYLLENYTDPEKQQAKLQSVKRQVKILEKMIENILLMTELDRYNPADMQRTNLSQIIRDIDQQVQTRLQEKNMHLKLELPRMPAVRTVNTQHIYRAIMNVVDNAISYSPAGGLISIRLLQLPSEKVQVEVTDTGFGIEKDDLPYVFDRFYRANRARTINDTGNGLGLTLAQQIIDQHEGDIFIESIMGQGTKVTLII